MDPNATLKAIRNLLSAMTGTRDTYAALQVAAELSDHVAALDEWLTKGGYLPTPWEPHSDWERRVRARRIPAAKHFYNPGA